MTPVHPVPLHLAPDRVETALEMGIRDCAVLDELPPYLRPVRGAELVAREVWGRTVGLCDQMGSPLQVAGVHLDLRFNVNGRFRYAFPLGRTGAEGVCRTTFEAVEAELEANRRIFLMDYNTPLTATDWSASSLPRRASSLSGKLLEQRGGPKSRRYMLGLPTIECAAKNRI